MLSTVPNYKKPLELSSEPNRNLAYWDAAHEAYDKKKFRNGILYTLNCVNTAILENEDVSKDLKINCNHGSAVVQINITEEHFQIHAPFLKIQNANKIALMRRVAEVNFNQLTLAQIRLKEDALWFFFKAPIELCHPAKVFNVVREICIFADDFDDEFIDKYKADYFKEPNITQLSDTQREEVWEDYKKLGQQYFSHMEEFERDRSYSYMWDIMAISMLDLANMPYVQGTLRTDLEGAIALHFNSDVDGGYRLDQAKKFLKQVFEDKSKEQFLESIYLAEKLVSIKYRSNEKILMSVFQQRHDGIANEINKSNWFEAAYALRCFFTKLLYDFSLAETHQDEIYDVLAKSSGQDTSKAAKLMWSTFEKFHRGSIEAGERRKKGFLSKLFS